MRFQIWIVALSFVVFGLISWLFLGYSPVYIGLMLFGVAAFALGFMSEK